MGYRGKIDEQNKARDLRAQNWLLQDIADELGVAKSSVSSWVRDVPFIASKRRYGPRLRPNKLMVRKQEEIEWGLESGRASVASLSEREFLIAGAAIYAGEGFRTDGDLGLANSDRRMILLFVTWLRRFFLIDESRFRIGLYLHEGLDYEAATAFWADLTRIPPEQHTKPYRAVPDPSIRHSKHPLSGLPRVIYRLSRMHREVMGLVHALLSCDAFPG